MYCENREAYCGDDFPRVHGAQGESRCRRRLTLDGRLEIRSVKLFADGALGSRGAALLEEYSDQAGWNGLLLQPESEWKPLVQRWYDDVSDYTISTLIIGVASGG